MPAIVVSPLIPKGTLVNKPDPSVKPFETSEYENTSVIATIKKLFNLPDHLTNRSAWAATFENILTKTVRDDCPTKLKDLPPPKKGAAESYLDKELDSLPRDNVDFLCKLNKRNADCGKDVTT